MDTSLLNIRADKEYLEKTKVLKNIIETWADKLENKEELKEIAEKNPYLLTDTYYLFYTHTPVYDTSIPQGLILDKLKRIADIEKIRTNTVGNDYYSKLYAITLLDNLLSSLKQQMMGENLGQEGEGQEQETQEKQTRQTIRQVMQAMKTPPQKQRQEQKGQKGQGETTQRKHGTENQQGGQTEQKTSQGQETGKQQETTQEKGQPRGRKEKQKGQEGEGKQTGVKEDLVKQMMQQLMNMTTAVGNKQQQSTQQQQGQCQRQGQKQGEKQSKQEKTQSSGSGSESSGSSSLESSLRQALSSISEKKLEKEISRLQERTGQERETGKEGEKGESREDHVKERMRETASKSIRHGGQGEQEASEQSSRSMEQGESREKTGEKERESMKKHVEGKKTTSKEKQGEGEEKEDVSDKRKEARSERKGKKEREKEYEKEKQAKDKGKGKGKGKSNEEMIRMIENSLRKSLRDTKKIIDNFRKLQSINTYGSGVGNPKLTDYFDILEYMKKNPEIVSEIKKVIAIARKIIARNPLSVHIEKVKSTSGDELLGYTYTKKPWLAHPKEVADKELFDLKATTTGFLSKEKGYPGEGTMYLLLDKSGSMTGHKDLWERAVATALALQGKKKKQKIYARFFTGIPLERFSSDDRNFLYKIMASGEPSGGTDIVRAIRQAYTDIASEKKDKTLKKTNNIVLITDGISYVDDEDREELVKKLTDTRTRLILVLIDTNPELGRTIEKEYLRKYRTPKERMRNMDKVLEKLFYHEKTGRNYDDLQYLLNLIEISLRTGGAVLFVEPDIKGAIKITRTVDLGGKRIGITT